MISWIEVFVISMLAAILAFLIGFVWGMDAVIGNCNNYGKQVYKGATYVCHKEQSR